MSDRVRTWVEPTANLLHLSVLILVPLLIAIATWLSNVAAAVSFLLFPPLAAGTYTLFANPEGPYSTGGKFVGGITAGALCGWGAHAFTHWLGLVGDPVSVTAAALAVFLTGAVTWALDLEEPTAFAAALLALVPAEGQAAYVVGIGAASAAIAAAFVVWRDRFYKRRARYLYQTTTRDDHVLVPMRWRSDDPVLARFASSLAGAHKGGRVVLFGMVEEGAPEGDAAQPAEDLEALAGKLEADYGVSAEVVVATGSEPSSDLVLRTARRNRCDLIVVPYEEESQGGLSRFVKRLFDSEIDVVVFRPTSEEQERWERAQVAVRGISDTSHAMVDFALRVTGPDGRVGACTCIDREGERRDSERMLADLLDAFVGRFETHVAHGTVETYLSSVAPRHDVIFIGSSTDRSAASRFISPPTFERLREIRTDLAIVHRGRH